MSFGDKGDVGMEMHHHGTTAGNCDEPYIFETATHSSTAIGYRYLMR